MEFLRPRIICSNFYRLRASQHFMFTRDPTINFGHEMLSCIFSPHEHDMKYFKLKKAKH